jgi:pilus assembly protein CpaB
VPAPPSALLRRAFASPLAWWASASIVALVAAAQVGRLDDEASARRAAWGAASVVVVAVHELAPGEVIAASDVLVDRWPDAVLPDGAVGEPPVGRTVTATILAGEAVVARRLAPEGLGGVAALVPDGMRAVAVPSAGGLGVEAPPLAVGDRVDVLATVDVLDADVAPTGAVATDAVVVAVGETSTTVAVPATDVEAVAYAVARGTVTLALVGAG